MECERSSSAETGSRHRRTASAAGSRRMYECTFCKRGFTNAQALGGHMNIHRRDRAKAKQNANAKTNATSAFEESLEQFHYISPSTSVGNSTIGHQISYPALSDRVHVQRYFPVSLSEPKLVSDREQDILRASLSLRIGLSAHQDDNLESVVEGDEIDLELRLGS